MWPASESNAKLPDQIPAPTSTIRNVLVRASATRRRLLERSRKSAKWVWVGVVVVVTMVVAVIVVIVVVVLLVVVHGDPAAQM